MSEHTEHQAGAHMACCSSSEGGSHCPMSAKFDATVGSRGFRSGAVLVGVIFILLGIAILIWPIIAVWLTAAVSILIGSMVLMMNSFFKKMNSPH